MYPGGTDKLTREMDNQGMNIYKRHRFQPEIIQYAPGSTIASISATATLKIFSLNVASLCPETQSVFGVSSLVPFILVA